MATGWLDAGMQVEVRAATADDAAPIRDVHLASIEGMGGEEYDDEQVAAWAHDRDPGEYPIDAPDAHLVVAERDDRVVGFGWLKPDAGDYLEAAVEGEVTAIYVHPSVARQGVGTAIYDELEARARQQGVGSLGLWASHNAVAFYESCGYSPVTEHTVEFSDGVEGFVVEMRKEIHG